jgi:putative phage-type endonuclease
MHIIDCEQGTPEWHAARCGRVTGSRVADVVRRTKTGISATRNTYMGELIAERLSGFQDSNSFTTKAMDRGKEVEPRAREYYAFMHNVEVRQIGLVIHPTIDMAAASPDSLVGEDGGLEIKVPNTATHIATLLGAPIDPDYITQIHWNMACTGRAWWDFVSFDDRLPAHMQFHCVRVHRDSARILDLQRAVTEFLAELDEKVAALKSRYPEPTSE